MRSIWILLMVILACAGLKGETVPDSVPNPLSAQQAADGWISLFDGESTSGWKVRGEARVEKGVLVVGGDDEATLETAFTLPRSQAIHVQTDWQGTTPPRIVRMGSRFPDGPKAGELLKEPRGKFQTHTTSEMAEGSPRSPLAFQIPAGSKLLLRDVRVRPLGAKSLFNGKDLTGWKVYRGELKRERSRWTVTPEGWLDLKDGPGDLQTEKTFSDFLLQAECRSNGKHLNSGIFFRCLPGQYQQGYEAQIRNQFLMAPSQKYSVEEYDPATNKLLGKKMVQSPAVDFGTGAIYRRIPAKKGVAKDEEWFTMTILARGRQIATWVNGVSIVDWSDHRPRAANGRNGYFAGPGAISIQGHDPTTDLRFRNIRIVSMDQ
ncbi:MAG: DUF1080 domain-containing protein [Gemmataceae bacterium]